METNSHIHTHTGSNGIKHIINDESAIPKSSILAKYRRKAVKLNTNHNNRKDFLAVGGLLGGDFKGLRSVRVRVDYGGFRVGGVEEEGECRAGRRELEGR